MATQAYLDKLLPLVCLQVVFGWEMVAGAILELSSRLTLHGAVFTEHSLDDGKRMLACGFVAVRPEAS